MPAPAVTALNKSLCMAVWPFLPGGVHGRVGCMAGWGAWQGAAMQAGCHHALQPLSRVCFLQFYGQSKNVVVHM